jgi:raffinose/stachyose/melibiose transport system permease protein
VGGKKRLGGGAGPPPPPPHTPVRRIAPVKLTPYLFLLPALTIYGLLVLWPLARLLLLSLQEWNGLTPERKWVGLDNYTALATDSGFWLAAGHNLQWLGMAAVPILMGLVLAVLLFQTRPRGRSAYRVIYFLPYTLPIVLVGIVWKWIYHPVWGPLNAALRSVGLDQLAQGWLGQTNTAFFALVMAANWTGYGFCMVMFLAGLSSIERELYEAAQIDGATPWQQFIHVTLPGLSNTTNVVVLIVFIATVRVFDIVYVTTGGGPIDATEVLGTLIYRQTFENQNVGYGSAISVATAAVILIVSLVFLKLREQRD